MDTMDTTYLIELRLGRTKWRIKQVIASIAARFHLHEHIEQHPHVTIFGPLVLNPDTTEEQLLMITGKISARYHPVPFMLDGWEKREGMHGSVIAISVRPSEQLIALTREVAEALLPRCSSLNAWDPYPEKKWFHVTIANYLNPSTADTVFCHLTGNHTLHASRIIRWHYRFHRLFFGSTRKGQEFSPPLLDETGLRLTIMKNTEILAEYDFLQKEWLTHSHDHYGDSWQDTLRAHRRESGFERIAASTPEINDTFVIADLHLGHANIIRYCSRPFLGSDVAEMDTVLIRNWNFVVGPTSRVYFIGDLRYGREALPAHDYLKQLKGDISFVLGNHDDDEMGGEKTRVIDYDGVRFLLVHDPADAPTGFDGWVIHGHHHNNDLRAYPFINPTSRHVNVSAEVIGYVPISLREICSLIRDLENSGNNHPIRLRYAQPWEKNC